MYQNPYPVQQVQPSAQASLSIVHGKDVALAYPSQIGVPSYFLDDALPYLYKKRLDNNGNVVEFRKFRLEEEIEEPPKQFDASNFATKEDITGIYNAIAELKNSIVAPVRFNNGQNNGKKVNNHEPSSR